MSIVIALDSPEGQPAAPNQINLSCSGHVHPVEIESLWASIRQGGFEQQAKALLTLLCNQRGYDAGKLLK